MLISGCLKKKMGVQLQGWLPGSSSWSLTSTTGSAFSTPIWCLGGPRVNAADCRAQKMFSRGWSKTSMRLEAGLILYWYNITVQTAHCQELSGHPGGDWDDKTTLSTALTWPPMTSSCFPSWRANWQRSSWPLRYSRRGMGLPEPSPKTTTLVLHQVPGEAQKVYSYCWWICWKLLRCFIFSPSLLSERFPFLSKYNF